MSTKLQATIFPLFLYEAYQENKYIKSGPSTLQEIGVKEY